jgi:hypothetical protein
MPGDIVKAGYAIPSSCKWKATCTTVEGQLSRVTYSKIVLHENSGQRAPLPKDGTLDLTSIKFFEAPAPSKHIHVDVN